MQQPLSQLQHPFLQQVLQSLHEQDLQQHAAGTLVVGVVPAENAGTAMRLAATASTMVLIIVVS
ncbi:MAG: hypothetical protein AB7F50_09150 [Fimbriimonadaceae bacterium]